MKSKLFLSLLATIMLLTSACSKGNKDAEASADGGVGASCINCTGYVAGATVFSGSAANGGSRLDGLQIVADANSLANAAQNYSNPKTQGTYQALPNGGTFTSVSNACLPDGTYQVSGFQVGMVSQSLTTQSASPMWVTLSGPTMVRAPLYIQFADSNADDVADAGTKIYMWVYCDTWTKIELTSY